MGGAKNKTKNKLKKTTNQTELEENNKSKVRPPISVFATHLVSI